MAKEAIRLAKWSELRDLANLLGNRIDSVVVYGTTARWRSDINFVPYAGQIVVWSDHGTITPSGSDGPVLVPGIKVGDGNAYNVDLPFVGDDVVESLMAHIRDDVAHVTSADRSRWDNKITTFDKVQGETLVLTRN